MSGALGRDPYLVSTTWRVSEPWQWLRSPREGEWKVWEGSPRNIQEVAQDEKLRRAGKEAGGKTRPAVRATQPRGIFV